MAPALQAMVAATYVRVKLADPSGSSAWACLDHADEILLMVRGAFIALHGEAGLAEFLAHRASEHAAH